MRIGIDVEETRAKHLQPGDLFSRVGMEYWAAVPAASIAEKVYLRTAAPCPPEERELVVYRITVAKPPGTALSPPEIRHGLLAAIEHHETNCPGDGKPCWGERCNLIAFLCHTLGVRGKHLYEGVSRILAEYDAQCQDASCKHGSN